MDDLDGLMDFATRAATAAGAITLRHFGSVTAELKPDGTEVTAADLEAEAYLRDAIREAHPADGIMGEEGSLAESRSGRRWIIDPIDGTRSFASGVPLYGVLLTLEVDGAPLLGCCHLPALGTTLVAATGAGAWVDGRRAQVSECAELAEARVLTSGLEYWRDHADDAGRAGFDRLVRATRFTRTWGDAYAYYLVAIGRAELLCEPISGKRWDYGPMLVILPEAGARISQIDGSPLADGGTVLTGNPTLYAAAQSVLVPSR